MVGHELLHPLVEWGIGTGLIWYMRANLIFLEGFIVKIPFEGNVQDHG